MTFENKYNPYESEPKIREFWEKEKIFKFDESSQKPVFSIDTPPPTISGKMHVGHAFSFSQQDFIARYKRMKGYNVYYPFGTDDNGLPTEKLVQKEKNINLRKLTRDQAIKECLDYLKNARPVFIQGWKNLGMSCDFELSYSTIDDYSRKISQESFIDLAQKNLVYRNEAPVIWDTVFQTAIAQAELEDMEKESLFHEIIFKLDDDKEIIIATTRPELLSACVAVLAHPDDTRYKHLFGKYARTPLYNAIVPIIADELVEKDKGTGIVMCCTFGDQKDIEWYKKHKLPLKMVITKNGLMNDESGKYSGLKIISAREEIVKDLTEKGLLKSSKKIKHTVNVGERSGEPVEIINSKQWYVDYLKFKEDFLNASEKLNWKPYFMKHRLDNWIKGLNWDWSIARQRSFGVPIPVWYCKKCGEIKYADKEQLPVDPSIDKPKSACNKCNSNDFESETDVFDTWYTSASSPFLAINLMKDKPVYNRLFPMDLRPQAHDIISFWLFYTLAKTNILKNTNPWKNVMISGWVLDPSGKKMSKSKGNIIEPENIMKQYSADGLRYSASCTKLGSDIPFQEKDVQTGIKISNKLYNASKFAQMLLKDYSKQDLDLDYKNLLSIDKWIISKLQEVLKIVNDSMDDFEYSKARSEIEKFFMQSVADNYIEIIKSRLWNLEIYKDKSKKAAQTIYHVLYSVLRAFSPFMVYITEDIYQLFFKQYEVEKSVHLTPYPEYKESSFDEQSLILGDKFVSIISEIRKYKAEKQLSMKAEIENLTIFCSDDLKKFIENCIDDFYSVTSVKNLKFTSIDKDSIIISEDLKIKIN